MMKLSSIFLLLVPLVAYGLFFSMVAGSRKIPLWNFWAGTLASLLPWVVVITVLLIAVQFLPAKLQQAGGMSVLFPMFCLIGTGFVSPIVSLFVRGELTVAARVKWFTIVSSIPAFLVLAFLIFVFINDSRHS